MLYHNIADASEPLGGRRVKLPASLSLAAAVVAAVLGQPALGQARPALAVVAAENVYGDIASQVAGPDMKVTSILANPDDDPHLFEASPSVAKSIADAAIVVYNGAGYDAWMDKLLAASDGKARQVIVAATLLGRREGANPHLWYDPPTAPAIAKAIAAALVAADPAGKAGYEARRDAFLASLAPLDAEIAALRAHYAGTPVTATEPVFGYMADALGFTMRDERFQIATMNDAEPAASDIAAFEDDLGQKRVKLLFYNSQAGSSASRRLADLARRNGIPVVGVSETKPAGLSFQQWMRSELDAVGKALSGKAS
jgi:zinc/manganese transport system substrate-binding protein